MMGVGRTYSTILPLRLGFDFWWVLKVLFISDLEITKYLLHFIFIGGKYLILVWWESVIRSYLWGVCLKFYGDHYSAKIFSFTRRKIRKKVLRYLLSYFRKLSLKYHPCAIQSSKVPHVVFPCPTLVNISSCTLPLGRLATPWAEVRCTIMALTWLETCIPIKLSNTFHFQ